jgi:hypothetical protein
MRPPALLCRTLQWIWLLLLLAAGAAAVTTGAAEAPADIGDDTLQQLHSAAIPAHPAAFDAVASFGSVNTDATAEQLTTAQDFSAAESATDAGVAATAADAPPRAPPSKLPSRVYVPVAAHLEDDPLQPLFSFDATRNEADGAAGDAAAGTESASVSSFATMVLRLQRRVTSVGFWQPGDKTNGRHRMHSMMQHRSGGASNTPPLEPAMVSTNTLNLLVAAFYARTESTVQRGLHLSVLPGPSFTRGSMAAHAEHFGAAATGFESALFSLTDHRRILRSAPASDDASVGEALPPFDEVLTFEPDAVAVPDAEVPAADNDDEDDSARVPAPTTPARLPGYGPIPVVRTVSGQAGENRVLYVSGVYDNRSRRVHAAVSLYSLLVNAWTDSSLARVQANAHAATTESALAAGLPPPPPLSLNALGLRVRISAEFAVRPFEFGVAVLSGTAFPGAGPRAPKLAAPKEPADPLFGAGAYMSADGTHRYSSATTSDDTDAANTDSQQLPKRYARIVDAHMMQKARLLLIGVAYDDGFIRILSRNASVRAEIHTRNQTVLRMAMSNLGTSTHTGPSMSGGAREQSGALNGQNNGNQLLAYVTPEGLGTLGMVRISSQVEQFCAWAGGDGGVDYSSAGAMDDDGAEEVGSSLAPIRSGHEVSALAFDVATPTVLYLALHSRRSIVLLHTRLGWNARDQSANFIPETGLRRPCPPDGKGCSCHQLVEVGLSFAPASASRTHASVKAASAAFFRPQFTLLPLRGHLVVGYNSNGIGGGALALFNATGVKDLLTQRWRYRIARVSPTASSLQQPRSDYDDEDDEGDDLSLEGLEFLFERPLRSATKLQQRLAGSTPTSIHMDRLVGDRIELLVAGAVSFCLNASAACGSETKSAAASLQQLDLFQLHLPTPASASLFSSGLFSSLLSGGSRIPLFLVGLAGVFLYQWWRRRQELMGAERGLNAEDYKQRLSQEDRELMRAFEQQQQRGGAGKSRTGYGAAYTGPMQSGDASASAAMAMRRAGAAGNDQGAFDEKGFMDDFLSWQRQKRKGTEAGGSTKKPGGADASSSHYMPELSAERTHLREGIRARRAAGQVPDPMALARAAARRVEKEARVASEGAASRSVARLEALQRERMLMRRKMDALQQQQSAAISDPTGHVAAHGLGIGGFEPAFQQPPPVPVRRVPAAASRRAPPSSTFDSALDDELVAQNDMEDDDRADDTAEYEEQEAQQPDPEFYQQQDEDNDEGTAFALAHSQAAGQRKPRKPVAGGYASSAPASAIIDEVNAERDDPVWAAGEDDEDDGPDTAAHAQDGAGQNMLTYPIDAMDPADFGEEGEGEQDEQQPWHQTPQADNEDDGEDEQTAGEEFDHEAVAYGEHNVDEEEGEYEDAEEQDLAATEDSANVAGSQDQAQDAEEGEQEEEAVADAARAMQAAQLD